MFLKVGNVYISLCGFTTNEILLKKHNAFLTSFFSRFNRDIFSLSEQSHLKQVKNESNLFYI